MLAGYGAVCRDFFAVGGDGEPPLIIIISYVLVRDFYLGRGAGRIQSGGGGSGRSAWSGFPIKLGSSAFLVLD